MGESLKYSYLLKMIIEIFISSISRNILYQLGLNLAIYNRNPKITMAKKNPMLSVREASKCSTLVGHCHPK